MYIKRTLEPFFMEAMTHFPVMLITGPRQVGKTTILQHLSKGERTYITLDNPTVAAAAREDPALFIERLTLPVLIDEIQYAPQLLPFIKILVDRERKPGMFWLTGSQQFHLMKGVSESLAGRVGIVDLLGFSLKELQGKTELDSPFLPTHDQLMRRLEGYVPLSLLDVYRIIWQGSYPAMWTQINKDNNEENISLKPSGADRNLFYDSYIQTYLQRDVSDLAHVGDEGAFLKFLRSAAARTGQLLNVADMARDAEISPTTAKRWLSILDVSGIIYLLEPYHANTTKRLVKAPKLYFLDTGLCSYLLEWPSPETLEAGAMSGAILETFIFTEILKSYRHNGRRAPLYYYRDKDKKEIDILIMQGDTLYPLEIKKTASPNKKSIQSFKGLGKLGKKVGEGGMICFVEALLPMTQGINAIPIGLL
jgi:uncharacterized protein